MASSTPNQEQQPAKDPRLEAYLSQNKQWASSLDYKPPIPFLEMQKQGRNREDGTVIVIACTDPRVTPEEFMGMSSNRGNKATIIRTAGGRVQYAIETLYVLAAVGNKGMKGLIIVVHHTDCGLCYASDEEIRMVVRRRGMSVEDGARFGCFVDPEVSVKEDVEFLRAMPLFSGTTIVGLVQDTQTGVLKQVI